MDDKFDHIVNLYEYFYRDLTGNRKFKFHYSMTNIKLVNSFIKRLDHRHDTGWLFDYFGFNFQIRSTQDINPELMGGDVKIMLSWVIGQKVFNFYLKASDEQKFWGREYVRKRGLKNPLISQMLHIENSEIKSYKDRERKRFFNTDLGLIHCNELELYDSKSKFCLTCKNKKVCIEFEIGSRSTGKR